MSRSYLLSYELPASATAEPAVTLPLRSSIGAAKDDTPVVARFLQTLQYIRSGIVQAPLARTVPDYVIARPAARGLLNGAHIENAVVQVPHYGGIRLLPQKRLIGMHGIAGEKGAARLLDVRLDVGEQIAGRLGRAGGRREHGGRQPGRGVCRRAPGTHAVEGCLVVVDDGLETMGLTQVQLCVCDVARYGEDGVIIDIETSHLVKEPRFLLARPLFRAALDGNAPRNLSIPGALSISNQAFSVNIGLA